jgi:hypothetical protein
VPAVAIEARGHGLVHVPVSVQVHAKASEVYFDLDVRLKSLGLETECPKR